MARVARLVALAAVAAVVAALQPAQAQSLPTLHVRDFGMSVDRASVAVGEPFHLRIVAHVAEHLTSLDNIVLPNLAGFEELGDERRCAATLRGTDCVETLTLDATAPGDVTIAPATVDAIDGRNRKPSRFLTEPVVVHVAGDALGGGTRVALIAAAWFAVWLVSFGAFVALGTLLVRRLRRPRGPLAAPPAPAAARVPAADPDARFRALVEALAQEPTRPRAVAVRAVLRERAGASERETLRDLAARGALRDGAAAALAAMERATFCEEEGLADAVREALPYLR